MAIPRWAKVSVEETKPNQARVERTGRLYCPPTSESFTYDWDGNLTQDGRWNYTWDGENRLISMETRWTAQQVPGLPQLRLEFAYDGLSRRMTKTVKRKNAAGAWVIERRLRFAYDRWNLIAEEDETGTAPVLVRSYQWSTDLSGTRHGGGGVGGLVMVNQHNANGTTQSFFPCYDGNGNITALLEVTNPQNVTVAAEYEYGPFGEPLRATGTMANANPFRFSTKYQDDETGLLYYGYRYYQPTTGRWLGRDPLGDIGFQKQQTPVSSIPKHEPLSSDSIKRLGTKSPMRTAELAGPIADLSWDGEFDDSDADDAAEPIFIAEMLPEGPNINAFVGNNPITLVDGDGTAVPIVVVGVIVGRIIIQRVAVAGAGWVARRYVYGGVTYSSYRLAQMAQGRHAHNIYSGMVQRGGWRAPYYLPRGGIPDAGRPAACVLRELKPNTASGIARGQSQIRGYLNRNPGWTANQLDVYNVPPPIYQNVPH